MKKILLILMLLFTQWAFAQQSFAPENDLWIPAGSYQKSEKAIQQSEFKMINNKLTKLYSPVFEDQGGKLVMVQKWEDGTVNAYTLRRGTDWEIHMFGGLARVKTMTPDGYAMVVCHEIGHQIGGLPLKRSWAAAEGQADYFASKCMRELIKDDANVKKIRSLNVPSLAKEQCDKVYPNKEESATCQRIAVAGEVLGTVLSGLGGGPAIDLNEYSKVVVSKTNASGYPPVQCRADTYLAGALCDVDSSLIPNKEDIHYAFCSRKEGYDLGTRPLCWYKPEE